MSISPLIGITSRRISGKRVTGLPTSIQAFDVELVDENVARQVAAFGGTPVILSRHSAPANIVPKLDGLVMSGGEDVVPANYGQEPSPHLLATDASRDDFEIRLVKAAITQSLPLLGICRGLQVINVALGGSLTQHLDPQLGFHHSLFDFAGDERTQDVTIDPASLLARLLGTELTVNSYHHQAVADPGAGVHVVARATDGVVEAFEVVGEKVLGVQWHPEFFREPDPVVGWLVSQARARATV
ncbi:gamma-glutamyl-gamma-aminobutyrate hydrolase family protein [Streptomyces sp. GbtcB6]|uniref:gamma-glutamyl-gamma-aminobutyrate hydrolase family protein n=1 Tax=Streptomyces sp. GbtcB6 TaxID=2824751 RepID=UPI001C2FAFA4|nr:gamma-glutamyl-gamma-aminobutyrate hydrolase family protein [Streptomyces sp. GbtcB6]